MRTKTILLSLLLLVGCTPKGDSPPPGKPFVIFQADSPIIVTDGSSIHFKKEYGIVIQGQQHASLLLDPVSKPYLYLSVTGCNASKPDGCNIVNPVKLEPKGTPWQLKLYSTELISHVSTDIPVNTLSLLASDTMEIDVQISPPGTPNMSRPSTFDIEDADPLDPDADSGAGIAQTNYHLSYAVLSSLASTPVTFLDANGVAVSKINCPTNPPHGHCRIRIDQRPTP